MNKREIITTFLETEFGNEPKKSLKCFINKALDKSEYYEGFEIAVGKNELDYKEYEELHKTFISAYGRDIPDKDVISKLVDDNLPQSYFTKASWLVSDVGEIYATDGLRVAKIFDGNLIWVTGRISFDGITLNSLTNNVLLGQWYNPTTDDDGWSELELSTADGSLLKGETIDF